MQGDNAKPTGPVPRGESPSLEDSQVPFKGTQEASSHLTESV